MSKTILKGSDYFFSLPIQECSVVGLEIWNEKLLRYYAHDQRVVKVENNVILFQIVGEGLKRLKGIKEMKIRKEKMITKNRLFMVETGKFNILLPKKKRF